MGDVLLLDASPDLSKNFSPDSSGSAFNNNSALLKVSAGLWADYRTAAGVEAVITAILQSSQFIYRTEIGDGAAGNEIKLSGVELAPRLSFAVWNSIPDEELLKLGESGELLNEAVLKKQV